MRKLKLFMAACALLAGSTVASADTSLLKESDGWQKITAISQTDIANNYYVFVANDADLMLGIANSSTQGNNALFYQSSVDPATDLTKVFYLEKNGTNYAMRNVKVDYLQFQTEWSSSSNDLRWRNNDQREAISWTGLGLAYADGAWTLTSTQYNRPLGIYNNGTGTPTTGNEIGANDAGKGQKFQIYAIARQQFAKLMGAGASVSSPKDLTGLIFNSDFENTAKTKDYGWTVSSKTGGNYNFNGAVEAWHYGDFDLHQTLKVPNGVYEVTVQALSSTTAYVYAGETKTYVTQGASGNFAAEKNSIAADSNYGLISAETTVTTGQLTFGIADPNNANAWLVFDNFKLYYKGIDLTILKESYNNTLAAAQAVDQTAPMESSVLNALKAAIAANSTVAETEEALETATSALQLAMDNANASIAAYASAKAYFDEAETILAGTNVYTAAAYATYYTEPKAKYEARTLTTAEALALVKTTTGWHAANTIDEILLSAWTIGGEQAKDYDKALYINTWSTEGNTDGSNFLAPFFEYWVEDTKSLGATNLVATVAGLNANTTYSFTIRGRVRQTNNATKIANGITMKVGNGTAVDISAGAQFNGGQFYIGNFSAVGQTDADGKLTATITVAANSNISWLSFYNCKCTEGEDLSAYIADYQFALSTAKANQTNSAYAAVTGKEKTDLAAVIAANETVDQTKKADLIAATEALNAASATFVSAAAVYNAFAELNKNVAAKLDVTLPTITEATVAADLKVEEYIVAEYTAAKAYTQDFTNKLGDWTNAPGTNKGESWDGTNTDTYYDEYNKADRAMTQSVVLPAGDYALIAKGRASVNGLLTLVVGGETVTFAHKSSVGRGIATDGTATFDDDATYANSNNGRGWEYRVMTFTSDGETATTLTFNWKTASSNWCGLDDIVLLCNPAALDYDALQTAYDAVTVPTLGFEAGEYAPYVNVANLQNIEAAKAMLDNKDADNQTTINDMKATLEGMTWTANTSDVECVYNGNFAEGQGTPAADIQKYGWTRTNGWGQFKNDGFEGSTAYYNQPGSLQYGNAGVYTMPLKANTIYNLTFKYASWENGSNNSVTASVLKESEGMAEMAFEGNSTVYKDGYVEKSLVFVTESAGNYILTLANSGNTVITGVSITKAASQVLEFADGAVPTYAPGTYPAVKVTRTLTAGKWATAVYPFAVSGVGDIAVVNSYTASDGVLNFKTATASEANVPFLMRSTSDVNELNLTNVEVKAAAATAAEASETKMIGVYAETPITNAEKNYVLSDNVIYAVGAAGATIPAYRAYFQVAQPASGRALTFTIDGGVTTAIEGISVENNRGDIYNLTGQRVDKAQKGLYIVNGKKVVMK